MRYLLLVLCIVSIAGHAGHQYQDLDIQEISMGWGGEGVYVRVHNDIEIMENCESPYFVLHPETPLFSENYSLLLSAYHAKQKVGLYISGCQGVHMQLRAVRVRN